MKKDENLVGQLSPEEIQKLKKEHEDATIFEIPFKGKVAYIKEPNRNETDYVMSQGQNGPLAMSEALIEVCWVGGDESLKEDKKFIVSVMGSVDEIIGISSLKLKNL